MTIFPPQLAAPLRGWRMDQEIHAGGWNTGMGAYLFGGRWNPKGMKVVYGSLNAATALLEVAVHKGFAALGIVPHVSTVLEVNEPDQIHVVHPGDVPEATWLLPGVPSPRQQAFGASLLREHYFVAIPSTVSRQSWNLLFEPERANGRYSLIVQESLAIDGRLNRPHS